MIYAFSRGFARTDDGRGVTEWSNFPYTLPVFLVIVGGAALWWWAASARKWFVGPRSLGAPEQLIALEQGLAGAEANPAAPAG